MNRSDIWSIIKKGIVQIKMGWKHYQTIRAPGWWRTVWYPSTNSSFSKSIKSLIFHIFLNLTYSLRKNISFPKCPKITKNLHKTALGAYGNKQRDLALLKTWPRYCQKGRVKRRQNSLLVYPRLNLNLFVFRICDTKRLGNHKLWHFPMAFRVTFLDLQ